MHQYRSYRYDTVHYCLSTSPIDTISLLLPSISLTDTTQFTSAPVSVLLIWYHISDPVPELLIDAGHDYPNTSPANTLQSTTDQYQSYWYPTIYYCPVPVSSTNPTYTLHYTFAAVPVLLICHSLQLPQYPPYDTL